MNATKLKVGIVAVLAVAAAAVFWAIGERTALSRANAALLQKTELNVRLAADVARLNGVPVKTTTPTPRGASPLEVVRLRGEVARLKQELASAQANPSGTSVMSGIKANPAIWKSIRDQNRTAMASAYKELANRLNLAPEQSEKLNDLLADNVMDNVDIITSVLRDGLSPEEMDPIFRGQEAALQEKVQELLGADALSQYQDFTQRLGSFAWANQFKAAMTGDTGERDAKGRQLYALMTQETQDALAAAGLPPDYQTVLMMNYRNIASESEADRNIKLYDGILERVAAKAGSFLTPEEITKFGEARNANITRTRAALDMNRKMMAPAPK